MKFDERPPGPKVQVGDFYESKGRRKGYWLVISIKDNGKILGHSATCLGLDTDFNIVSGCTYGVHAFERRRRLGWTDITKMRFEL